EWLEGHDLSRVLGGRLDVTLAAHQGKTEPPIEIGDAIIMARRIASALSTLHQHGITHRDVKPANIFLVDGRPDQSKLIDLGGAAQRDAQRLTATGALVGTPAYMAPEQVRSEESVGPASDVWALGCVLYECLVGAPAFRAEHLMALLAKILLDPPPQISGIRKIPSAINE